MMPPFGPKLCGWPAKVARRWPAARALNINAKNINAKLLYQWQKAAQQPLPADPHEAAEVRALRAQVRRQAQELEIVKKAIAIFSHPPTP